MATTPGGLPYPVGTDKVVDGDDAIHALAVAVDERPFSHSALAGTVSIPHGTYTTIGIGTSPAFTTISRGIVYTAATGIFTLPIAGLYRLAWGVSYTQAGGSVRAGRILLGGATTVALQAGPPPPTAVPHICAGTRLTRFAAGAQLQLATYHDAGVPAFLQPLDTYLDIEWAGV